MYKDEFTWLDIVHLYTDMYNTYTWTNVHAHTTDTSIEIFPSVPTYLNYLPTYLPTDHILF